MAESRHLGALSGHAPADNPSCDGDSTKESLMSSFLHWLHTDTLGLVLVAVLGIAFLLWLIMHVKLEPFVSLLIAGFAVALAAGIPATEVVGTVQKTETIGLVKTGVGGILGSVAVVIGLGSMLGALLEASGGAEVLAKRLIDRFGEERAPLAMGLTGLIFGIPIFFDIGIFVLAPLVYVAALRSKRSILIYCLPLIAGLSVMHAFLPPHPGPVAAAGLLHVQLGWVIIMGLVCGLPAWIVGGYFFSKWIGERIFIPVPMEMVEVVREASAVQSRARGHASGAGGAGGNDAGGGEGSTGNAGSVAVKTGGDDDLDEGEPVTLGTVLAIIGTPLVLILMATVSSVALSDGSLRHFFEFIGNPFVALTVSLLIAAYVLGIRRGWAREDLAEVMSAALKPVGMILLVVGAGGFFGAVLEASGVGEAVAKTLTDAGLPLIVLAYLISCGLRIAQGSATVAIIATAGIVGPLVLKGDFSQAHTALLVVAISAGSIIASHVNDGGFWIVSRYFGIPVKETLKTWTVLETILSVVGFGVAAALSIVI
jgi:GntP family gluconate:H+ symporter